MQPVTCLLTCILLYPVIGGCNSIPQRIESASSLAMENGFTRHTYAGGKFSIVSFQRKKPGRDIITIYIEGDGKSWINRRRVSSNPTPDNPVALKLAIADESNHVVYLARPCQYQEFTEEDHCQPEYWTSKRTSQDIVDAINDVISQIKREYGISGIRLVGYSGGASIAALIAAARQDILDFRSVAGNLDIKAFTDYHGVTPLHGSINPVSRGQQLVSVAQLHYYSEDDEIIKPEMVESYLAQLRQYDPELKCIYSMRLKGIRHGQGWPALWLKRDDSILRCQ